ncbi:unnamed protein product [Phytophthora lilii]|uniref:RxLR effector protein n=1 Tax=Phytophthora lilii TaxID=2077276 RepID=A0A9W6WS93_9STRA|nr:unnamed protein product [Phytophthora lilii]
MQLSYILLLVSALTLLASGNSVSATTSANQSNGLMKPSEVDLIAAGQAQEGKQRFLRVHEDEERFEMAKINQLMNDSSYRSTKFGKWVERGYTDSKIYNKLGVESHPAFKRVFNYYQTYLENYAPRLISS